MKRSELIQRWYDAKHVWLKAKSEEIRIQRGYEFTKAKMYVDFPAKTSHYQRLNEIAGDPIICDLQLQLDAAHKETLRCWLEVGRWQLELKMNPEVESLAGEDGDDKME